MDLTNRDVREITMSKYFNKKTVPYWIIALLVVLIAIILAVQFKANSSSQTTTTTVKTSSSSEKASSSTKKYVAGKDYTIKYYNVNSISKSKLDAVLSKFGALDFHDLIVNGYGKKNSRISEIRAFYNKTLNWVIIKVSIDLPAGTYSSSDATDDFVYSVNNKKLIEYPSEQTDTDYDSMDNRVLVYDWENLVSPNSK
ncbi:alanyl-tRNA synthetase [Leuconostoc pseudomesenteroides]|uniref:alanyl-tRNA synthetase n=1 Tax=Leuconostoc pseudomesenteroides TaxID=33968 RepID=UPI00289C813B|nr:alanyl-tRNA synthetase [Leuconostoc pseudomesenteroides]